MPAASVPRGEEASDVVAALAPGPGPGRGDQEHAWTRAPLQSSAGQPPAVPAPSPAAGGQRLPTSAWTCPLQSSPQRQGRVTPEGATLGRPAPAVSVRPPVGGAAEG